MWTPADTLPRSGDVTRVLDLPAPGAAHAARGDQLALAGRHRSAIGAYNTALELTPAQARSRTITAGLLAAIGDAAFRSGLWDLAVRALGDAVRDCGALSDPLVFLRLGQARFERGELDQAADDLMRAVVLARGTAVLADEDPKYLAFLGTRLDVAALTQA